MVYIGIPSINLKNYLVKTTESIRSRYPSKILVVDNFSQDGTREWLKTSGHEYIFNSGNIGVAKNWNQILNWGLSHKDCDLVCIFNNDIVLRHDTLDRMVESVLENGKPAVTAVNIGNTMELLNAAIPAEPRYSPAMDFSCFGLTPSVVKKVGLFDEEFKLAYFEDNDYHHRMMAEDIIGVCDRWAPFLHYASKTIQEAGVRVEVEKAFRENKERFRQKYGFVP